jgi:hypothetical protein
LSKIDSTDYNTQWVTSGAATLTVNDVARLNGWADSSIEVKPRANVTTVSSINSTQPIISWFTPATNITVSQITMATGNTPASGAITLIRMGLYATTDDGTTGTLLARTDNDTTLFLTGNTVYTRSFSTTGGYPASVTLTAGNRYGIAIVQVGGTGGNRATYTTIQTVMGNYAPTSGSYKVAADLADPINTLTKMTTSLWGKLS